MKARDVIDVFERVSLFRAQASDFHRRVEDIGGDLDSAIALLDLRQSREGMLDPSVAVGPAAGVTQGVYRAVLDWSTGVIVKLAAGLLRPTSANTNTNIKVTGSEKTQAQQRQQQHAAAGTTGGDSAERHDRNARRWLSDPRIWQAFVRSLEGATTASIEPSTHHFPQAASLGVLRAAIFAVSTATVAMATPPPQRNHGVDDHCAFGGSSDGQDNRRVAIDKSAGIVVTAASEWALAAIRTLCGCITGGSTGQEGDLPRLLGSRAGGKPAGQQGEATVANRIIEEGGERQARQGGKGALMRVSLDAYVIFLEEVVRGHRHIIAPVKDVGGDGGEREGRARAVDRPWPLAEEALIELLRFQVVLQEQQTNRRKVFGSFCSKLMGSLFEIIPESTATLSPLKAAAMTLAWDALFHEEILEGYREAFTATEAASAAAAVGAGKIDKINVATAANSLGAGSEGVKKKRRRKNKGVGGVAGTTGGGSGGGGGANNVPRRACYQQDLFEEISSLACAEGERPRLGAMTGAPLLLEGFIVRLKQAQRGDSAADIHEAVAGAAISGPGGKRSRSSGGAAGHSGGSGSGGGGASSPASQMFRLWAVLTSTLAIDKKPLPSITPPKAEKASTVHAQGKPTTTTWRRHSLVLPSLRASNSMLELLATHDVYRINEDWGGLEFDQLHNFSVRLIRLAVTATTATTTSTGAITLSDYGVENTVGGTFAADSAPAATVADTPKQELAAVALEFVKAFRSLLGLNHNILHDDLRPVLRMTFEWAAMAEKAEALPLPLSQPTVPSSALVPATTAVPTNSSYRLPTTTLLRAQAVGLVVSLVDTYGRLRQMDHLVQALFGAISDRPTTSASVLRGNECTAALGCAFRQLPEGQIESMWHVFALHLRKAWNKPSLADADGAGVRDSANNPVTVKGGGGGGGGADLGDVGGGGGGNELLLARELDAELFVLFVRNIHVTSSIASAVGKLCTSLAEESLRSFEEPLHRAAVNAANPGATAIDTNNTDALATSHSPSPSKKKKKKKRRKSEEQGEGGQEELVGLPGGVGPLKGRGGGGASGAHLTAEKMLPFQPALDVHGWLLDLDTRCRFWSAVLGDDSSSSTATNQQQNAQPKEHTTPTDGDITSVSAATLASTSPSVPPLLLSDGTALPRIIAAAATALESNNTPAALLAGNDQGNLAGWGSRLATESPSPATARLLKTLQQVAVHRVQQIYARLNGISALEGSGSRVTPATTKTTDRYGTATDTKKTNHIDETRAAVDDAEDADMSSGEGGAADKDQNDGMDEDERLETEARRLVAFACGACESRSVCGGGGGIYRTVVWGDENRVGVNDRGASWSMMMPYLPVWVGFAATEQVALFLEALFSKCAADLLAGRRGEEDSPALRLLTDASFYEMEAVAQSAPVVVLTKVYLAVKHTIKGGTGSDSPAAQPRPSPSVQALVASVQALAKTIEKEEGKHAIVDEGASGGGTDASQGEVESVGTSSGDEEERILREACCLVMLTMRFPPGFLDNEAVAGLLLAADALDSVCVRTLSRQHARLGEKSTTPRSEMGGRKGSGNKSQGSLDGVGDTSYPPVIRQAGLVETVTALRGLILQLGLTLPPGSHQLERLPAGKALSRVVESAREGEGETQPLLRASAALLPFLAERCVATGKTKAALGAVARLGLTTVGDSGDRQRPRQEWENIRGKLVLLHGLLSGLVAGESRRLGNAAAAAALSMEEDGSNDDDDLRGAAGELSADSASTTTQPWLSGLDQRLFATVSHVVGCLPTEGEAAKPAPFHPSVLPALFLGWGDALRLSFLGPDAQRLVFAARKPGRAVRTRSHWVEDFITFIKQRSEAALEFTHKEVPSAAGCEGMMGDPDFRGASVANDGDEADLSERSASCHLLRAVCGCSHLLDPPLPRAALRVLVEAFLAIIVVGESGISAGGGCGGGSDRNGGAQQWQSESNLLQTAFCLLVQHSSENQLDEIIATLLGKLEMPTSKPLSSRSETGWTTLSRGKNSFDTAACRSYLADAAVTLVRLTTQAGRGAAYKAVLPNRAISLAAALCRQLRGTNSSDIHEGCTVDGGRGGRRSRGLRSAAGALDALDGLLNRQPYASVTARVVSVVLGSVEPAARAALHAATESLTSISDTQIYSWQQQRQGCATFPSPHPSASSSVAVLGSVVRDVATTHQLLLLRQEDVLRCFRSCCRAVGTVLQHYAGKVFSCTPPFAALCRSLLRLFFRLAVPATKTASTSNVAADFSVAGGTDRAEKTAQEAIGGVGRSSGNRTRASLTLSLGEQVSAAGALSRVLEQFVPNKKVLKKYAAFLLLEYVSLAGSVALEPAPRAALLAGVFAVIEACTRREMRQLHGLLGALPTGQEVFRSLHEEYQRQHKYTGKM